MKKRLTPDLAKQLGFKVKKREASGKNPQYYINKDRQKQLKELGVKVVNRSTTKSNEYSNRKSFVLSAWNKNGYMMDIDEYCKHYKLPKQDITSYKLVSHTGTPFYNIVFKENITEQLQEFDFDSIISKYIKPVKVKKQTFENTYDFDVLTFTDMHIGMDTNKNHNSMYADDWNHREVMKVCYSLINDTLKNRKSKELIVDDLGDLLDGFDGKTTRGGHDLPQNMTNEQAFDCALEFKVTLLDGLAPYYESLTFNNVCNDNHSGSFGYFANKAFKEIAEAKYEDVKVNNHRTFLSHYFKKDVCFIISHGKDDSTLKFGFKPQLDSKQIEKIDQYCKQMDIFGKCSRIIFKKGDSHQALFDMCTSDDFDYMNYPAASPASQWIQQNFKKGRRGYVIENFKETSSTLIPIFN